MEAVVAGFAVSRSSFRLSSASRRTNAWDMSSRSSREAEDEEENLKWAALMKLPTYDRLRKGILVSSGAGVQEVNIHELGLEQRKHLIDKLVGYEEEQNEKFLHSLRNRINRVGIALPTIEVRFQQLSVDAEATTASRSQPTIVNFFLDIVESFFECLHLLPKKKQHLSILKDVNGIIKPNRMTLLLGPPRSGKTTLLLALAGALDSNLKVSGSITYNGHTMDEFVPQRTAAYISQHDLHIPQMTVRETLAFSARCQGVGSRQHMLEELLRREKEANVKPDSDIDVFMKAMSTEGQKENVIVDYVLKMLGLEVCADTIVGNAMIRGISGGQMKRLTTGEMLVGPARALFMDEISTGLDSSTTFQIVNYIRQFIHILDGTALISLLQPSPETYNLFDDIILLSDGHIVYQGPRENVLQFFERMGFRCPERKGAADFLQEVTSKKDQQQYWVKKDEPYVFVTAHQFSEEFKAFHIGRDLGDKLAKPFDKTKSHPAALETREYGLGAWELLAACFAREVLLLKRNSFVHIFKCIQLMIVGFVAMTVFLRTKMHKKTVEDGGIFLGSLFFAISTTLFNGMVEIAISISKLPVFFKHRNFNFYPAWAFAIPTWIVRIPLTIIEVCIWVIPTYYVIGYDPSIVRFFKQMLVLLLVSQTANAIFRCIAVAARNITVALTYGAFAILILFCLGGYVLSRDDMKKWWKWASWLSPLLYGQTAVNINEFLGRSWRHSLPYSNQTLGVEVLKSRGFFSEEYWFWLSLGALVAYIIIANVIYTLCLTFLGSLDKPYAAMTTESRDEVAEKPNKRESNSYTKLRNDLEGDASPAFHGTIVKANKEITRGMILPFEPHSIVFDSISYAIDMPAEMKARGVVDEKLVILQDITGAFRPGVLTALMGVSGAGKTTLMDVLAGRKTGGYIDGEIYVSGYPKKQETFARISGYCEQFDIHSPHVTVHESLVYSAWLRLPRDTDTETRKLFVEDVMKLVELNLVRNAMVGLPNVSGLSTDQRKRLTVAVELVANPSIIFMDEPTTGLDARAAAIVMRTVRNTVNTGRTVVCTIHQPSIDIFESFDELLLLKQGGEQIYSGPLGIHSSDMIKYFESINGVRSIKEGYNPATWMLEVTSIAQEQAIGTDFVGIYKSSDLHKRAKTLIQELSKPAPGSMELHFPTKYSQSWSTQFMACLWKQYWSYWRNPSYTAVRLLYTAVLALTTGSMFWNLGSKRGSPQDLFNALGSMYVEVFFIGVQNTNLIQPIASNERTVFYRERAAGMYSAVPYAFAQVSIEVPYAFVQSVIYGVIIYAMIGFEWSVAKFMWYLFFLYFTLLYFTFFGFMSIALTPSLPVATILGSAFYPLWNLFAGFVVPLSRIQIWWKWYYWICPVSWTIYGLLVSQFGDVKETLEGTNQTTADFIRNYYGYNYDFLGVVAVVVAAFAFLFAFIYAIAIKYINFQRR